MDSEVDVDRERRLERRRQLERDRRARETSEERDRRQSLRNQRDWERRRAGSTRYWNAHYRYVSVHTLFLYAHNGAFLWSIFVEPFRSA